MLVKHKVQKMTEVENDKMREKQRRIKEVTQDNNYAHRSLNERQFRVSSIILNIYVGPSP
jgi:hypothetical protein